MASLVSASAEDDAAHLGGSVLSAAERSRRVLLGAEPAARRRPERGNASAALLREAAIRSRGQRGGETGEG